MPRGRPTGCPGARELSAYLVGNLGETDLETIADHLEHCPTCQARVGQLDGVSDALLTGLRSAGSGDPAAGDDRGLRQIRDRLRRLDEELLTAEPARDPGGPAAGERVGPYRLLRRLGRGGMGEVFQAVDPRSGRLVAVKVLGAARRADPAARRRFRREARATRRLDHPQIVRALDAGELPDGTPYLVLEYAEGVGLERLVKGLGPLTVADACELVRQAAVALHHAHRNGLVHRDVKPSNLLLARTGPPGCLAPTHPAAPASAGAPETGRPLVKVLDLGLALCADELADEPHTTEQTLLGTRDYMAPEQWDDTHAVDARTDVYSLGCTLHHLLTGQPPFGGPEYGSILRKLKAHAQAAPPRLRARRPDAPAALEPVLARALAKRPQDRFPDAFALAGALAPFAHGADPAALLAAAGRQGESHEEVAALTSLSELTRATRPERRPSPAARRRTWRRWALVGALAGALAVSGAVVAPHFYRGAPAAHEAPAGPPPAALAPAEQAVFRHHQVAGARTGITALAVSPDGARACSASIDGALKLWRTDGAGEPIPLAGHREAPPEGAARNPRDAGVQPRTVRSIAFAPDGRAVFSAGGWTVRQWDAATGQELRQLPHPGETGVLALSSDGRRLLCTSGVSLRTKVSEAWLRLWDPADGRLIASEDRLEGLPKSAALSPDGQRGLVGMINGRVYAWDPAGGAVRDVVARPESPNAVATFLPDGHRFVLSDGRRTTVWDTATVQQLAAFPTEPQRMVWQGLLTPDGRTFVAAVVDNRVHGWDLATGRERWNFTAQGGGPVHCLALAADGRRLLTGGPDGTVRLWELPPPE
jgi:serine/threonine protein kinase/WD40 repeat protein